MVLNPSCHETSELAGDDYSTYASSNRAFFERYNVGVLLCANPLIAAKVVQVRVRNDKFCPNISLIPLFNCLFQGLSDPATIEKLIQSIVDAEKSFHVRTGIDLESSTTSATTPRPQTKSQADRSWRILAMMAQSAQLGQVYEGTHTAVKISEEIILEISVLSYYTEISSVPHDCIVFTYLIFVYLSLLRSDPYPNGKHQLSNQSSDGSSPHQFTISEYAEISARISGKSLHH